MKNTVYFFFLSIMTIVACQSNGQSETKNAAPQESLPIYTDLSVAEFKTKMSESNVVVLDVRTADEIAEGKIEGAIEMDFHGNGFEESLDGLDKSKTYLVYCKSGGRSSSTCEMMSEKGFKQLYNLEGGFTAWSKEN